jgi:hypothetical protein
MSVGVLPKKTIALVRSLIIVLLMMGVATPTLAPVMAETKPDPKAEATVPVDPNAPLNHEAVGVSFTTPPGFSKVKTLEKGLTGVVYPETKGSRPQLVVRLAEMNNVMGDWVRLNEQEMMSYARFLFLGNNNPGREFNQRTFMGKPLMGEVRTQPSNYGFRYVEIYLLPLSEDRTVAIAFEADTQLPLQQVEDTINTVADSIKELPTDQKKKKK